MTKDNNPTIYALATPPGVGALAIIRLSGPGTKAALSALAGQQKVFTPRFATLACLTDPASGVTLDQALITFFEGPYSFTGEDVAELSLHGGRAVVQGVLSALAALPDLRLAEPGEFTRRAFLNHKLDLTEAEAVADLIHAETALQRTQALAQLGGSLKDLYDRWRDDLIHAAAYIEAHLDFPDEDLPDTLMDHVWPKLTELTRAIARHLDDKGRGEIIRDGFNVVILGAPNVGKSSLLNTLARREAAIVSPVAGTTRDLIDIHLDLDGYPVTLTDTAGLRPDELSSHGQDQVEVIGIARALDRARHAHLKIVMFDAGSLPNLDPYALNQIDETALVVLNKIDTSDDYPQVIKDQPVIPVSIQNGTGIDGLIDALKSRMVDLFGVYEGVTLTRARHRAALTDCHVALVQAQQVYAPELVAEELRGAIASLSRLTGRIDVENLLDVIFHDFCIGK